MMFRLVSALLWSATAFGSNISLVEQCSGCHAPGRTQAPELARGVKKWADSQCFGCHAELNEIRTTLREKTSSSHFQEAKSRLRTLPFNEERILGMRELSYLQAPLFRSGAHKRSATQRLSKAGLLSFLRRPVSKQPHSLSQMPSFPKLKKNDLLALRELVPFSEAEVPAVPLEPGREVWESQCSSCHGVEDSNAPQLAYLSLFTAEWIYGYANASVVKAERTMPRVSVSLQEAQGIWHLAFQERRRLEEVLEQKIAESENRRKKAVSSRKTRLAPGMAAQVDTWLKGGELFMKWGCVHCHTGNEAPAEKFLATPSGFLSYVSTSDQANELFERLRARHLELELGIVSERPSMPLTQKPVPLPVVSLLEAWVENDCPSSNGKKQCME